MMGRHNEEGRRPRPGREARLPEQAQRRLRSLGRGMRDEQVVLITGSSSARRALAVRALADRLGRDVFTVDTAAIVSRYIEETEKNLDRVLREAEAADWILFFDEADALFGRRTEVRDAHDRYANTETNALLERLEQAAALVVLATSQPDLLPGRGRELTVIDTDEDDE